METGEKDENLICRFERVVIFSFLILCKFCAHKKEFNKTQQKQKMTRFVLFCFGLVWYGGGGISQRLNGLIGFFLFYFLMPWWGFDFDLLTNNHFFLLFLLFLFSS
jgi:hypothetical protein